MKKSNFVALVLSVMGSLVFGLGMCMCMLPQWNLFKQGIIVGGFGALILLIMVAVYRKMEHKAPIKINKRTILIGIVAVIGVLGLGIGMCLTMVFAKMILGILVGIAGIVILLCLIPLCKGIKE